MRSGLQLSHEHMPEVERLIDKWVRWNYLKGFRIVVFLE
jgi:hypothetical protein